MDLAGKLAVGLRIRDGQFSAVNGAADRVRRSRTATPFLLKSFALAVFKLLQQLTSIQN
jgi:hypothetical protein